MPWFELDNMNMARNLIAVIGTTGVGKSQVRLHDDCKSSLKIV